MGVGAGLRPTHYEEILKRKDLKVDWFEAISENFMDSEGRPLKVLTQIRERFPLALHGVSYSVGTAKENDSHNWRMEYLKRLKKLIDRVDPFIVSDHLCWTGVSGKNIHDLLPLPYTEESLVQVVENVNLAQDFLKRQFVLENPSTYFQYSESVISETEFLSEVVSRTGCGLLLDVNNVYVNAINHQFSDKDYIDSFPINAVVQIHLAGHTDTGQFLFDTHSRPVIDAVWELFTQFNEKRNDIPILIEWDDDIPEFKILEKEVEKARSYHNSTMKVKAL